MYPIYQPVPIFRLTHTSSEDIFHSFLYYWYDRLQRLWWRWWPHQIYAGRWLRAAELQRETTDSLLWPRTSNATFHWPTNNRKFESKSKISFFLASITGWSVGRGFSEYNMCVSLAGGHQENNNNVMCSHRKSCVCRAGLRMAGERPKNENEEGANRA